MNKINVICIKWGNVYSSDDVNKLYRAVKRNTTLDVDFYCFTENSKQLEKDIIVKPLPSLNVAKKYQRSQYLKEAALCDDNLGGEDLNGKRVFFFDIDTLIVGNLDELFLMPQNDEFYIIKDWKHPQGNVGQASCYSFVIGTLGFIKKYFEENADEVWGKYYTASQEYLSAKIIEKYGHLNFWPENWSRSFRFHCMPNPLLRHFVTPKMPKVDGLKMIIFHGVTGIPEAVKGVWCSDVNHPKYPRGYKKLYKHVLPTTWINDYWK